MTAPKDPKLLEASVRKGQRVNAGQLIAKGIPPQAACQMALVEPLTDDLDMRDTLRAAVSTFFPEITDSSKAVA